ncbi:hypothetical protein GGR56DRAFT_219778 [Xylariaceae sp. FL0804]|nr:hypothetical protein GGR56DRAFT_219778 [Xylariaceae sp. FL0804]
MRDTSSAVSPFPLAGVRMASAILIALSQSPQIHLTTLKEKTCMLTSSSDNLARFDEQAGIVNVSRGTQTSGKDEEGAPRGCNNGSNGESIVGGGGPSPGLVPAGEAGLRAHSTAAVIVDRYRARRASPRPAHGYTPSAAIIDRYRARPVSPRPARGSADPLLPAGLSPDSPLPEGLMPPSPTTSTRAVKADDSAPRPFPDSCYRNFTRKFTPPPPGISLDGSSDIGAADEQEQEQEKEQEQHENQTAAQQTDSSPSSGGAGVNIRLSGDDWVVPTAEEARREAGPTTGNVAVMSSHAVDTGDVVVTIAEHVSDCDITMSGAL